MSNLFKSLPFLSVSFACVIITVSFFSSCKKSNERKSGSTSVESQQKAPVLIGEESSVKPLHTTCRDCHQDVFDDWHGSHHALANRLIDPAIEDQIFHNSQPVEEELSTTRFRKDGQHYEYVVSLPSGEEKVFRANMVLGHYPLFQYLVPKENGAWQSTDLAYDPDKKEFFSVTGESEYEWDDWLHWTNGAMNWNANCAQCHMTGYKKNYDAEADKYHSTWDAQGITCLQCHTGMEEHIKNPTEKLTTLTDQQDMQSCATCHSRRLELTEDFKPGDNFHDHYRLQLPSRPGLYYPDGQIQDEVFVYGSFIMSKMGHAGVTCKNCHDPHSNQLILPAKNNMICMQCHDNGQMGAPIIDPTAHSFHAEGSAGNQCVNCHMTHTTYMQRDPRRDHGFHIPDPQLTKEMGIPNACNKCHEDQTVDWAIEWTEKWYGEKMERPERDRSRIVQQVYDNLLQDYRLLVEQYDKQEVPAWKATLLEMMGAWTGVTEVDKRALAALKSGEPLLRVAAIRCLQLNPAYHNDIRQLLEDSVRVVRIDAAWALRDTIDPEHPAAKELVASLELREDQPSTAAFFAQWYQAKGEQEKAIKLLKRAVKIDERESAYSFELGLAYNNQGKFEQARQSFKTAIKRTPDNAYFQYQYALFENEQGNLAEARNALLQTVAVDPEFSRAWYNLALMYSRSSQFESADRAIDRAMQLEPSNIDFAYAKATILAQKNEVDRAIRLLEAIIIQNQQYRPALQLYQRLIMRQRREG